MIVSEPSAPDSAAKFIALHKVRFTNALLNGVHSVDIGDQRYIAMIVNGKIDYLLALMKARYVGPDWVVMYLAGSPSRVRGRAHELFSYTKGVTCSSPVITPDGLNVWSRLTDVKLMTGIGLHTGTFDDLLVLIKKHEGSYFMREEHNPLTPFQL